MNKFSAILYDTLLEIKSGKVIFLYAAVMLTMILIFGLLPSFSINGEDIFKSGMLTGDMLSGMIGHFFSGFLGFVIFLMVFGSAWLLPSYLGKGRVEMVLSKPISRINLITMKFFAVFIIKASILVLMTIPIYLVLTLRIGAFSGYFFLGLFITMIQLLIIYAIVFVIGLLSRSGALAVMGYFVISIVSGLLSGREAIYSFLGDSVWKTILDLLYHILPKFSGIDENFTSIITGNGFVDMYPIYSSLGFAAVIYLIGLLVFRRHDY